MPLMKLKEKYTVQDYLSWPDEERWEIVDGIAYDMSPAPNTNHQTISRNLTLTIGTFLRGKPCKLYVAPTDVILSDIDVVQPDVFVVCDPNKITPKNIQGAPDLAIEILSPTTSTKDRREKFELYEKYGVREYLIVDPDAQHVQRFTRDESGLFNRGEIFDAQQIVTLQSLEGLEIPLWEIFEVERKATE